MSNQAWEEHLFIGLWQRFGEHELEKQVKNSSLMQHAMTPYHQDIVLTKEPRSYQKLKTMVNAILEQQQQNFLISQIEKARNKATSAFSLKDGLRKRKTLLLLVVERFILER